MDSAKNLKTFETALKDIYLPFWNNQLGITPSPLLGKIKKIAIAGNNIVAGAPIGLSGGFGFSSEGNDTPAAGHVINERFREYAKDMYVNVCISQKAIELGGTAGAMTDALKQEVEAAYDAAKWNVGRSLYGDGTGKLADVDALSSAGNVVTVDDTKNLKEGIIIDFYPDGAPVDSVPTMTRRIVAVDRVNNTITIDGAATTVDAGFITIQKSFGNEITGLNAIFDDNITTLYGVSKSANPYIKPVVVDADNDITDGIITKALRQSSRDKNGDVDMFLCGDNAYDAYVSYLRENNIRVEDRTGSIEGGFKTIRFMFGNKLVDIVNESFVPAGEMWGVDTKATELHQTDWKFAVQQGGSIFTLKENQSVYRALLVNYGNLICKNPGSCIRIKNVAYATA